MWSLYRTLSLRFLQQRRGRALLIAASITLGVATLVATRVLNESVWVAARTATTPLAGLADLYVANGDAGVPADLAQELTAVPGVRSAEPLIFGRVRLPDLAGQRTTQVLGITWSAEVADHNPWGVRIEWLLPLGSVPWLKGADPQNLLSSLPGSIRPVLLGEALAADLQAAGPPPDAGFDWGRLLKWIPGSRAFPVNVQAGVRDAPRLVAVGVVHADRPANELVKNVVFMDAADAGRLLGQPAGLVTRLDVFLDAGADRDRVASRVKDVVAGRAAVRTPEANDQRLENVMAGLQLGFSLSGACALVVGLFLVYNALAASVAERRHEIGILRSLGATRLQTGALFVGEAGFLGLIGAAFGVPAGLGLAHLGLQPIQGVLKDFLVAMEGTELHASTLTIVIAVLAGIATALVAALVPAVGAASEEPASAVRRIPPRPRVGYRALQLGASIVLLAVGTVCMVWRDFLPARTGMYGGFVLVLISLLLTTPLLAAAAARLLQPLARLAFGIAGRLAADNLVRSPGRTGLVITALASGVTMFMQTAGVIRSNNDPILDWMDRTLAADLYVSSGSAITGNGQNLLLSADLGPAMRRELPDDVAAALPVRNRQADYGDETVLLIALDAGGFYRHGPSIPGREFYPRLTEAAGGNALVSRNFAALHHVGPGDDVQLRGPGGPLTLHVVGAVEDYDWNRGTVIVDRAWYERQFQDPLVDQFWVFLKPGSDPDRVRQKIDQSWGVADALVVWDRHQVRDHLAGQIQKFAGVAYAQEVVVGLVAALGVVTALLISVLQRRRELGILRAVGATQSQVLRSVLAEALLMGVIGAAIGLVVGVAVEWYLVRVIFFEETGFLVPVLIPWKEAGIIAGMALVTAALAGLGPALRTLHLRIPEAIAYE